MNQFLLFCLAFCLSLTVGAATFTVTKTADTNDGVCDGDCSLREAIVAANAAGGADIVVVPAGTYTLTLSSQLTISSDITIDGAGESTTIIEAAATSGTATWRVFEVTTSGTDVIFEDVTIRHGRTDGSGAGVHINLGASATGTATFTRVTLTLNETFNSGSGAGLRISDDLTTVTMTNCTISNNTTVGGAGGILQSGAGTFSMTDCTISSNTASADGGGIILSEGSAENTFTDCTISGNMGGDDGGGLFIVGAATVNSFTRCIISGNIAGGGAEQDGGGIYCAAINTVTMTNCTITGNSNAEDGGGFMDDDADNTVTFVNCTVANNTASGAGGGIRFSAASGQANMTNCIVADNSDGSPNDIHFTAGTLNTNTTNLVENCTSAGTCPTFSVTDDPKLMSLNNNGGTTQTLMPRNSSPAIDKATTSGAPTNDQRTATRPHDDPDVSNTDGGYDIGAVERQETCIELDGTNDHIDFADGNSSNSQPGEGRSSLTVEAWVQFDQTNPVNNRSDRFVSDVQNTSSTQGWMFGLGTGSTGDGDDLRFIINDGSEHEIYTDADLLAQSTSAWYHIAVVFDNSQGTALNRVKFYINGTEVTTGKTISDGNFNATTPDNTLNMAIGGRGNGGSSNVFDGKIDEVRIWHSVRSAAEISASADEEVDCSDSDLFGCYHLDDGIPSGTNTGLTVLDGSQSGLNGTPTNMALTGGASNFVTSTAEASIVLPVELTEFKAYLKEKTAQLIWQTASESNNKGFEIEWSVDNREWENIGFVKGAGDSYHIKNYKFIHNRPKSGLNYYRLKQTDFDGNFEYSDVVSVNLILYQNQLTVYPNPLQNGHFIVELSEPDFETGKLSVFNALGHLIQTETLSETKSTIVTGNLPQGIYLVVAEINGRRLLHRLNVH